MRWIMDCLRRWQEWRRERAEEKARFEKAMEGLLEVERAWEQKVTAARGDMEGASQAWKRAWLLRGSALLGGIAVIVGGFVIIELFGSTMGGSIGGGVAVAAGLALACVSAPWRR